MGCTKGAEEENQEQREDVEARVVAAHRTGAAGRTGPFLEVIAPTVEFSS